MSESMVQVLQRHQVYERGKQKIEVLHGRTWISRRGISWRSWASGSGKTTLLN